MGSINLKKMWFVIYIFLAIFEPPILPVPFIYVLGLLTLFLIIWRYKAVVPLAIGHNSHIIQLFKLFLGMLAYLLVMSLIDVVFIENADLFWNRIRCVNQLIVLSFIELVNIWYIFILADEQGYGVKEVFGAISISGAIQGMCSIAAYINPSVRFFFVRYGDRELFQNAYFIERRGYGFSMTLIDTFSYGMGLIVGYIILQKWEKQIVWKLVALVLSVFSIFVNARTGIVIIIIALILKVLQGENKVKQFGKIIIAAPIIYFAVYKVLPLIFEFGIQSKNITVKWVSQDMSELYMTLLYGSKTGTSLRNASFFSNFGNLPENAFEYIFGSGHSIYDTSSILGFRTDVGFINLWWEFGLIGMGILLLGLFIWMARPIEIVKDTYIRSIVYLNVISFFLVLFKAILIGYNPGIVVNYLATCSIYYFCYNPENVIERENYNEG